MLRLEERASTKQDCFVGSEEKMERLRNIYRGELGAFK
jgi:hypothetical protein